MCDDIIKFLGLLLSFLGSIIIALSVKENPGGAHQLVNGKKVPLASIFLNIFRFGIILLIGGFLLQMAQVFSDN